MGLNAIKNIQELFMIVPVTRFFFNLDRYQLIFEIWLFI